MPCSYFTVYKLSVEPSKLIDMENNEKITSLTSQAKDNFTDVSGIKKYFNRWKFYTGERGLT